MVQIKFALPVCKNVNELRREVARQKLVRQGVGLVPTMGALHEGHMSLIQKASKSHGVVILSIFVNPLQFGAGEDLDSYPRRLQEDVRLGSLSGATVIFAPTQDSFYNSNHQTTLANFELENLYCGEFRPGHFRGVLTVVAKLLMASIPDTAYFGKKDYQQLYLINRMVTDLNIPVKVLGCVTKRETSGLAKSSRNEYLSENNYKKAASVYQALKDAKKELKSGKSWIKQRKEGIEKLEKEGFGAIQYFELVDRKTLLPQKKYARPAVLLIAVYLGETRLIDNLEL